MEGESLCPPLVSCSYSDVFLVSGVVAASVVVNFHQKDLSLTIRYLEILEIELRRTEFVSSVLSELCTRIPCHCCRGGKAINGSTVFGNQFWALRRDRVELNKKCLTM